MNAVAGRSGGAEGHTKKKSDETEGKSKEQSGREGQGERIGKRKSDETEGKSKEQSGREGQGERIGKRKSDETKGKSKEQSDEKSGCEGQSKSEGINEKTCSIWRMQERWCLKEIAFRNIAAMRLLKNYKLFRCMQDVIIYKPLLDPNGE